MAESKVEIFDIMACNVYWDFENTGLQREQHKFLVAFYPPEGATIPELVDRITAHGPDGYRVEIANETFTPANRNGHIYDRTTDNHWYMVNLDTGFMPEGEYTIEVKCRNGETKTMSRYQKDAPGQALVSAYEQVRSDIFNSYRPANGETLPDGSGLKDIEVKWTPLSELAGQDAYYIFRLSRGRSSKEFDTQNLAWWDNIFLQRMAGKPRAGLNKDGVVITNELQPRTSYVHFTEITDSNAMGETNICIFQPHQTFTTAAAARRGADTPSMAEAN